MFGRDAHPFREDLKHVFFIRLALSLLLAVLLVFLDLRRQFLLLPRQHLCLPAFILHEYVLGHRTARIQHPEIDVL